MIEAKFNKDDYIINRAAMDMAIVKDISKKGYYQFKAYYSSLFDELKDLKNNKYELQVNYQKFWDLCNDDEKQKLDEIIKEKGGK
jgi:hypothetical protein